MIDTVEVEMRICDRTLGIVDESCVAQIHRPDAPEGSWIRTARGLAHLECPPDVINVRTRLESWTAAPPVAPGDWSALSEAEVVLPTGALCLYTTDEWHETPMTLPSAGRYALRVHWALSPRTGPFDAPFPGAGALQTPAGHERELDGVDQFCLAQVWYLGAAH
ncbi:hypothetical protein AB0O76_12185 [Streptomyces sp. NPDC086554]|uniref:hypothetical protein n=1 Tax=Streptomyces sp. NPDC086554 TaxID=3154864 RepID=UPI003421F6D1